ncbi:MAG: ribonuclease III [Bacteroidia bacterium]
MIIKALTGFYLSNFSRHKRLFRKVKSISGITPVRLSCYYQALRHHSVSTTIHESGYRDSNERLEYLGDSVLNAVIAELLFNKFPYKNEGFLTEMRSKIVSRQSLNELAIKLSLDEIVEFDKRAIGFNTKNSIFGNALEAFIGAIFLDHGFAAAKRFIKLKLLAHVDIEKLESTETNFKGRLIEWSHKFNKNIEFECEELTFQKNKIYRIKVLLDRVLTGDAEHLSKKKAEQLAAQKACEALGVTVV